MAITWDFVRQIDAASMPGNTISYYDKKCQAFYIDDGKIKTQISELVRGQWQDVAYDPEIIISDNGYSLLDIEHHYNDVVFGSAYHDGDVVFLVYEYRIDAIAFIQQGLLQLQPNNGIKAAELDLSEIAMARLKDSNYSLFAPGVKMKLNVLVGEEETPWVQLNIDSSPYNELKGVVTVKAKNTIANKLLTQTFDDEVTFTGTVAEIVADILDLAGVVDYLVDANATSTSVTFESDQSIFDGLNGFCEKYGWYVDALNNDTIIVGTDAYIQTQMPIVIYTFERDSDVISRYSDRSIHPIYSRVCVRRTGATPLKVFAQVTTYDWDLPTRKTFYKDVPDDMSQGAMESLAASLAADMQYTGIMEVFTTAFRPWLQIGDGAIITGETNLAGIITDVQHSFGSDTDSFTQITVCSGGTMANTPPTLTSKYISRLGHMDRTQQILNYLSSPDRR